MSLGGSSLGKELELVTPHTWEFKIERRQENITAEMKITTLHLKPFDDDEADISSIKVNLTGDPHWAKELTPERAASIMITFGDQRKIASMENSRDSFICPVALSSAWSSRFLSVYEGLVAKAPISWS